MKNKFKIGDRIICETGTTGITEGYIYTVTGLDEDGDPRITDDDGDTNQMFFSTRFELVSTSGDQRIEKAKSLIGKSVKSVDGDVYTPDSWGIGNQYEDRGESLDDDGIVVVVENDDYINRVQDVELVTNVIKLTDDYDAIIEKNMVKVGCQNVPIEKVREILAIWESLHG